MFQNACRFMSLHADWRSMSLHSAQCACMQFPELTWSSMSLDEVSWACMQFHELVCSSFFCLSSSQEFCIACCQNTPSWLKVVGWWWWVACEIILSSPGTGGTLYFYSHFPFPIPISNTIPIPIPPSPSPSPFPIPVPVAWQYCRYYNTKYY